MTYKDIDRLIVQSLDLQSTEERIVGYDAVTKKHIYQRTFIGNCTASGTVAVTVPNMDKLIKYEGYAQSIYNNEWPIGAYPTGGTNYATGIYKTVGAAGFTLSFGSYYSSSYPYRVTVRYTKTTD